MLHLPTKTTFHEFATPTLRREHGLRPRLKTRAGLEKNPTVWAKCAVGVTLWLAIDARGHGSSS